MRLNPFPVNAVSNASEVSNVSIVNTLIPATAVAGTAGVFEEQILSKLDEPLSNGIDSVKEELKSKFGLKSFISIDFMTLEDFLDKVRKSEICRDFILKHFGILNLSEFNLENKNELQSLLYPNVDFNSLLKFTLSTLEFNFSTEGITDHKSFLEYVYLGKNYKYKKTSGINGIKDVLSKIPPSIKTMLGEKGVSISKFTDRDIEKLCILLGWEIEIDTSKKGLIDKIKENPLFINITKVEELFLYIEKLKNQKFFEFDLFLSKHLRFSFTSSFNLNNRENCNKVLQIGNKLGLLELDISSIKERFFKQYENKSEAINNVKLNIHNLNNDLIKLILISEFGSASKNFLNTRDGFKNLISFLERE